MTSLPITIKPFQATAQEIAAPYCSFLDPKNDLIYIYTGEPTPQEYYLSYLDIVESEAQLSELTLNIQVKLNGEIPTPELTTFWTVLMDRNNDPTDNCPDYPHEDVDTMYSIIYDSTTMEWKIERSIYQPWGWDVQPTEAIWQVEGQLIQIAIPTDELTEILPEKIPWKVMTETFNGPSMGDIAPNKGLYYWPPAALDEHMINGWPQFRRNWAHTAFITLENPPPLDNKTTFVRSIPFANKNNTLASSPIVGDGMVFVATTAGKLFAYDAITGATKWSFQIEEGIFSTPALSSGLLYIAGYDNKTYVLDAKTGSLLRSRALDDIIISSIAHQCGQIFLVSTLYGNIYAYSQGLEELKWSRYIDGGIASTPAISAGMIFIGSLDNKTYALDASDGSIIWTHTTEGPIYSSPAYYNGTVYVGSFDGSIRALDAYSGSLKWTFKTDGPIVSSPATASKQDLNWTQDLIFVGSSDGKIYSIFAEDGSLNWAYQTDGNISFSSPAIASYWEDPLNKKAVLYIGSMDRHVYALDAITGDLIWKYETGGEIVSSPAIAYDRVYISSLDGCLYVFGPPDPIEDYITANTPTQNYEVITWTFLIVFILTFSIIIYKRGLNRRSATASFILLIIILAAGTSIALTPKVNADLRNVQCTTKVEFSRTIEANIEESIGSRKSISLSWKGKAQAGLNMSSTYTSRFNAYWGRTDPDSWERDWPNGTTVVEVELKTEVPRLFAEVVFESDLNVKKHKIFDVKWSKEWEYKLKGLIGDYEYLLKKGTIEQLHFTLWIIGVEIKVYYKLFALTSGLTTGRISTDGPYIPNNIASNPQNLTWQDPDRQTQSALLGPVNGSVPIAGFNGEVYLETDGIKIDKLKLSLEIWVKVRLCFVILKAKVANFRLCTISIDFLDLLGINSINIPAKPHRFTIAEYPFLAEDPPPTPSETKIQEDLNKDGVVNIIDVTMAAMAFGSRPGDPKWNPAADIDGNGVINIVDIAKVARKFGYPP